MTNEILKKLDELAKLKFAIEQLQQEKDELLNSLIPPEIKLKMQEISVEYDSKLKVANDCATTLEESVRQGVLTLQKNVKGTYLQISYNPGKVSWDSKGLDNYAKLHPELLIHKKRGNAFTTLRAVMEKKKIS